MPPVHAAARLILAAATASFALDVSAIDRYMKAELELNDIPGASVAVARNGQIVYTAAFGVRSAGTSEPVTADTPVDLASVSKSLTAVAVKQLTEQGSIDRDAPVTRYLPELGHAFASVKLSHLIRHTSGLTRRDDARVVCCGRAYDKDLNAAVETLAAAKPARGAGFVYANSNYILLAAIVERVTGRPFPLFMEEEVFRPLGMLRTTLDPVAADAWGLAEPHEPCWRDGHRSYSGFLGWYGSSLVKSTATDMIRYLGWVHSNGARGWSEPYDNGWFIRRLSHWPGNPLVLEHGGNTAGGNTAAIVVPAWRLTAVVLLNAGTHRAAEIARALATVGAGGRPPRAVRARDNCGSK